MTGENGIALLFLAFIISFLSASSILRLPLPPVTHFSTLLDHRQSLLAFNSALNSTDTFESREQYDDDAENK
jgi:hypothetical protein